MFFSKPPVLRLTMRTFIISLLVGIAPLCAAWQSPPEQFTTSGAGFSPDVASNSTGHAMAVWVDNAVTKASFFTGGKWGSPTAISTSTDTGLKMSSQVALDDSGNALAIWISAGSTNNVYSAFFNGTSWSEPQISPLDSSSNTFQSPAIAMDGAGNGISGWIELTTNEVRERRFFHFHFGIWQQLSE
jgi:hypothetical protein